METYIVFDDTRTRIILETEEPLEEHPLSQARLIVRGSLEGLSLEELITRAVGHTAKTTEVGWNGEEDIYQLQWICESCILGFEKTATARLAGENVCQACAECDRVE